MDGWPYLQDIPIYTVGPATSCALKSIPQIPQLNIFGSETGNGEALAYYILGHYENWYADRPSKPPLLFLVGEQRRDIIPKTLIDPALPENKQIPVEELVVYETGVMESFEQDFGKLLQHTEDKEVRWIIVFSPTGCEAMLRALNMLDIETGKVKTGERGGGCGNRKGRGRRRTYIATIGLTTRDYLRKTFGFEPDVCSGKPSAEGIDEAINIFMEKNYNE
jgi:uroporphyrinogen-III synthase